MKEKVELAVTDGTRMTAYVARPEQGGPHPGILLFQEAFGVNRHIRSVSERLADLIGRALSKSNTSPEVLGERQARFEAEIATALEPFVRDGVLLEYIGARASIFGRLPSGDQHCSES